MPANIIINGKFLLAPLEGLARVALELTSCFDELLEHERYKNLSITVAVAKGGKQNAPAYRNIEVVEVGNVRGSAWEQIDLPMFTGGRYLVNFMNTAPVTLNRGCVVVHDAQFRSSKKSHTLKTAVLFGLITPFVAQRYTSLVTVSNYAKTELLTYKVCERDDIKVILNGVDHVLRRKVDAAALAKFNLTPHTYALANSYVHEHKNVRVLFESFAKSPERELVLFGSSKREEYLERGIEVPANVRFIGRVSDDELVSLMKFAKLFLFPSKTEGFGLPPLEAMLLGCPTICAHAGAMVETCEGGVLFADPMSPADWTAKINSLWSSPEELQRLSAAGQACAAKFKWATAAEQYLDLIVRDVTTARD